MGFGPFGRRRRVTEEAAEQPVVSSAKPASAPARPDTPAPARPDTPAPLSRPLANELGFLLGAMKAINVMKIRRELIDLLISEAIAKSEQFFNQDLENSPMMREILNGLVREAHEKKEYRPCALSVICDGKGKLLFVQSPKAIEDGNWTVIQGGVEKDEDILDGLIREVREEMGIREEDLTDFHFVAFKDVDLPPERIEKSGFSKGKRLIAIRMVYKGEGELQPNPEEIGRFGWANERYTREHLYRLSKAKREFVKKILDQGCHKKTRP